MTPSEFKHWFEGFTEAMTSIPNSKQWARIKERVGQIDNTTTFQTVFVDKYWSPVYGLPNLGMVQNACLSLSCIGNDSGIGISHEEHLIGAKDTQWNSATAFSALGRQEFSAVQ